MALTQARDVGIFLVLIALVLIVLINPFMKTVELTIPMAEQELLTTWDEEMDLIMQQVIVDPAYSHAIEEHPDTAGIVHDCFATKGQYIAFQIEPGKRFLRVCLVNDTTLGFQIVDIVGKVAKEKTAYIKENIKCLRELFEYARRMGYSRFTKPF